MDYFRFREAMRLIEQKAAARSGPAAQCEHVAIAATNADAVKRKAASWHEKAVIHLREGDPTSAIASWQQALLCGTDDLSLLNDIGQGLRKADCDPVEVAKRAWLQTELSPPLDRFPNGKRPFAPDWKATCLHVLHKDWDKALTVVEAMSQDRPKSRGRASNLAFLLHRLGQPGRAQCVLGANLLIRGDAREAAETLLAAPKEDAQSPAFLAKLLSALFHVGEVQQALKIAEDAVARDACPPGARLLWAYALMDLHRYADANDVLAKGAEALNDWQLRLEAGLILPAVPATQTDMDQAHKRACRNIHALKDIPLPTEREDLAELEEALEPIFYMAYLGEPCVDEARAFGRFVHRVVSARFPQFNQLLHPRRFPAAGKIRVGYATDQIADGNAAMRYLSGWLQHADRNAFELHLFPLKNQDDWMSGYLGSLVDCCHDPATNTDAAARLIRAADLDVLVYPEIGMAPISMRLAALRLAPVQCVAQGHPVTTGLPTLDYFISNDAMEPANAAGHYTERLVTLAGIGLCVPPAPPPAIGKSRADFGLPQDAVIYLAAQSLFKFLPRNDDVFARICEQVDRAIFVFAEGKYPAWTNTFRGRITRSFEAHGLDAERHVHFIPWQGFDSFLSLNIASDVYLDTIGWSGGLTALDALSCNLPMVVLSGELMRGRQSYGFLRQLDILDTIATDLDDYVDIAARLGRDAEWRREISQQIRDRRDLLFDDTSCVRSLEAFFRWAVAAKPRDDGMFTLWPARCSSAR
jgi:protein O-GlcNAc transferase